MLHKGNFADIGNVSLNLGIDNKIPFLYDGLREAPWRKRKSRTAPHKKSRDSGANLL